VTFLGRAALLGLALSIAPPAPPAPNAAPATEKPPQSLAGAPTAPPPLGSAEPARPPRVFDTRQIEGGGTLLLKDIMALVRQSPLLASEVAAALKKLGRTPADTPCVGKHLDGRWRHLAGARVEPYVCRIGERWLEIRADLEVRGRRGETYVTASDITRRNARSVRESNPRWTWRTTRPADWILD
jgi:hypothetical protein